MVKSKWKPSQSGSGYYKKSKGRLPKFIRFYRSEDGHYEVDLRKGFSQPYKNLFLARNRSEAVKKTRAYMRRH